MRDVDRKHIDSSSSGLVIAAGAWVKAGLVSYHAVLEQQNLLFAIGQFWGPIPKR